MTVADHKKLWHKQVEQILEEGVADGTYEKYRRADGQWVYYLTEKGGLLCAFLDIAGNT